MSETTDIAVLEIKPEQAPALYVPGGLDSYLEQIRQQVNEVPDLTTVKGRTRIASLAALVSRSKTAVEKPGRDYLRRLKEAVKPAESELRRWVTECDALRDETRRPLTEWEAEQDRIKQAEEARIAAEKLSAEVEAAHELALLMNKDIDRERDEAKAEAERQRIAYEEELKRQAAENARKEAEKAAAEREQAMKEAKEKAERDAKEAAERNEREKQEAIEAEKLKARLEVERIKHEAEQAEAARLAEVKRAADEQAKREKDVEHRRTINTAAVEGFIAAGVPEEWARECVKAIARGQIPSVQIRY